MTFCPLGVSISISTSLCTPPYLIVSGPPIKVKTLEALSIEKISDSRGAAVMIVDESTSTFEKPSWISDHEYASPAVSS